MTWTPISSPTRRAAAAPASVAALTAPTSPRTVTSTSPAPTISFPSRTTLAALTIASAASIAPVNPLVSIIPRASIFTPLLMCTREGTTVHRRFSTSDAEAPPEGREAISPTRAGGGSGLWRAWSGCDAAARSFSTGTPPPRGQRAGSERPKWPVGRRRRP